MKTIAFVGLCFIWAGCREPATPPSVTIGKSHTQTERAEVANRNEQGVIGQPERVDVAYLNEHGVIGRTGRRLGEICQMTATIERADSTGRLGYYVLRVSAVNGVPLATPVGFPFQVASQANRYLPADNFELYELKMGREATQLNASETQELEQGHVGSQVEVIGFETGRFDGLPIIDILPQVGEIERIQFSTRLIVLERVP